MFYRKTDIEIQIDAQIAAQLKKLVEPNLTAAEYDVIVERITKLEKLKPETKPKQLSPDTVLAVVANLVGIYWMTTLERERPITSKALTFVMKPRG